MIKFELRLFKKHRLSYIISILGLAFAFVIFLLVENYFLYETSYDRFHKDYENTYRISFHLSIDGVDYNEALVQIPVREKLLDEFSDVRKAVRIFGATNFPILEYNDIKHVEKFQLFSDPEFFEVFGFKIIRGNKENPLREPNSIVLKESTAKKYFGNLDPIGKTITYNGATELEVTAIVSDEPVKSHIRFDALIPFSFMLNQWKSAGMDYENNWLWTATWTYVKLAGPSDKPAFEERLRAFVKNYFPDRYKNNSELRLQPISEIHTSSNLSGEIQPNTSDVYLSILAFSAIFILVISISNFVSLNTSTLLNRAKEFSIKGIIGSRKMFAEMFRSTFITMIIALFLALAIAFMLQGPFNELLHFNGDIFNATSFKIILIIAAGTLGVTSLAVIHPYSTLEVTDRLAMLKDKIGLRSSRGAIRRWLTTIQVLLAFLLVFGSIIIREQMKYLLNKDIGFDKQNVLILPAKWNINKNYEAFKESLLAIPEVKSISSASEIPGKGANAFRFVPEGFSYENPLMLPHIMSDFDFIPTLSIPILKGRNFNMAQPSDTAEAFLVNEAFLREVKWTEDELINKRIELFGPGSEQITKKGKIIGLVRDFHTESLHTPIKPLVISLDKGGDRHYLLKLTHVNEDAIRKIEKVWTQFEQEWPFEYSFLNEQLQFHYENETQLSKLSSLLSVTGIFLAFAGLFGSTSNSILIKYKEVAIKKVLGIDQSTLIYQLTMEEMKYILLALIIEIPLAYFIMENWLSSYAFKIDIESVFIVISLGIVVVSCMLAIGFHLIKLITSKPIKYIRND